MKFVFLDIETLFPDASDPDWHIVHAKDMEPITSLADECIFCHRVDPACVADLIKDADAVFTNKVKLGASNLNEHIKMIGESGTGLNNIDLEVAKKLSISVRNCVAYGVNSVAQHAIGLMLGLVNNITLADRHVGEGKWAANDQFCLCEDFFRIELANSVLGVIGGGAIGSEVARLGSAIGMRVMIAERKNASSVRQGRYPFEEVIKNADVLSLNCPLTPETKGLIGPNEIASMKDGSYIVNVARGGVVEEPALADALRSGKLGGAATDVLTEEPPKHGNPLLSDDLRQYNLIITPHVAWGSEPARKEIIRQLAVAVKETFGISR